MTFPVGKLILSFMREFGKATSGFTRAVLFLIDTDSVPYSFLVAFGLLPPLNATSKKLILKKELASQHERSCMAYAFNVKKRKQLRERCRPGKFVFVGEKKKEEGKRMKNFVSSDGEGMQSSSAGRRVHHECSVALRGCPAAGAGLFAEGAALPCSWLWVQAVAALCCCSPLACCLHGCKTGFVVMLCADQHQ